MGFLLCYLTVLLGIKEQQSVLNSCFAAKKKKKNTHESEITILSSRHEDEEPCGFRSGLRWIFCHYLFSNKEPIDFLLLGTQQRDRNRFTFI